MIFSYKWLQDYIKGKLPKPKILAELLTMKSFEVEGIRKAGRDYVLDIDVLPNRAPDCFGHIGIAREIAAVSGLKLKHPDYKTNEDKKLRTKDFVSVEVQNKNECPRYTAKIITGVKKVGPSPEWLKERLKVLGLRPVNNIVDITNYVMLETGQPLHAFDFGKIASQKSRAAKKIIVRRAKKGEKIITLEDKKYDLDEDILLIADPEGPLAIAGIKGGNRAKIDQETNTVLLEAANFNSRLTRKASRRLNLKTDSSCRFESGIDPNLTKQAINRAAGLLRETAGGRVASGVADVYPQKALPGIIKLDLSYPEKLLGTKIGAAEIRRILTGLGFRIVRQKNSYILVEIPTFRLDIALPEDLVEEIGRMRGYDNIPPVFPTAALIPPKKNDEIFWNNQVKNILKEAGFSEVYNYSFVSEKTAGIFGYKKEDIIELENPVSSEQRYLRPSLIPNLLKNIEENQKRFPEKGEIKIFESGKTFKKIRNKTPRIAEKSVISGLITGDSFYQIKGVLDMILNKFGIANVWYDEYRQTPEESKIEIWNQKKSAEIKVDQSEIGFMGEISSGIAKELKIKGGIFLFDIDSEKLEELASEEHEYQSPSPYPEAVRDIAVLVPSKARVADVLNIIEAAGGGLVRDVELFDIYEGEEIPENKKNLAFRIIYQAQDRTLDSGEIDVLQNKIIKALEKDPGWEVRK